MSFDLGSGITVRVDPPPTSTTLVVPLAGPTGPAGEPGPTGPEGPPGPTARGYVHTQSSPAQLVQIIHDLPMNPAGIVCLETDGTQIEYATVTYPAPAIVELTFGVGFTGQIILS